jgi:hypothetical protein
MFYNLNIYFNNQDSKLKILHSQRQTIELADKKT